MPTATAPAPTAPKAAPAAPAPQAITPTPQGEYNPARAASGRPLTPMPDLTAALQSVAGTKRGEAAAPSAPAAPSPANMPVQPLRSVAPPPKQFVMPGEEGEGAAAPAATPPPTTAPVAQAPTAAPPAPSLDAADPKVTAPELRAAYARVKEELTATLGERELTQKEIISYRAKVADYEARIKVAEAHEKRATEAEKRATLLDEQLRVRNYVEHPEFHERYVKPVADAVAAAHALMAEMVVEEGDGRQATPQDFDAVLSAPNINEATRTAKRLFGDDMAHMVMQQRQKVLEAKRAQVAAHRDATLKAQEWHQQEVARATEAQAKFQEAFAATQQELRTKYAAVYAAPEGDADAAAALTKGSQFVDTALASNDARALATVRERAAALPMTLLRNHRLEARVAELEAQLKSYQGSEPSVEGRGESNGQAPNGSALGAPTDLRAQLNADLKRLAAQRRR